MNPLEHKKEQKGGIKERKEETNLEQERKEEIPKD